jgi:cytochrome c556
MKIKPRKIRSRNKFRSSMFGYYRDKFGALGRIDKEEKPFDPLNYTPGLHTLPDSVQHDISDLIKESMSEKIRKHASREVSKYMKTPDGATLKSKVRELIKGRMRGT